MDELTRGCTSDGDILNGETYYCKNKPWSKVTKRLTNSIYHEYNVYVKDSEGKEETVARYYWDEGDYHCKIYGKTHFFALTNYIYSHDGIDLFDGVCSKRDFVDKVKKTIKCEYNVDLPLQEIKQLCFQDMDKLMELKPKREYLNILLHIADRSAIGIKKYGNDEDLVSLFTCAMARLYYEDYRISYEYYAKIFNEIKQNGLLKVNLDNYLIIFSNGIFTQDLNKKLDFFNKSIEKNPNFANAFYARAHVKYLLNYNPKDVISDLEKAINLNPKATECYLNMAIIKKSKTKNYESALEDVNKCIDILGSDPVSDVYYIKAQIEKDMGNYSEAMYDCNKACELDKNCSVTSKELIELSEYLEKKTRQ